MAAQVKYTVSQALWDTVTGAWLFPSKDPLTGAPAATEPQADSAMDTDAHATFGLGGLLVNGLFGGGTYQTWKREASETTQIIKWGLIAAVVLFVVVVLILSQRKVKIG